LYQNSWGYWLTDLINEKLNLNLSGVSQEWLTSTILMELITTRLKD
jgi:hypothetical protein